jgi:hypothetical protein
MMLPVPNELACVECGRRAELEARGWQGLLIEADDDGGDEVIFFCALCAAHEFGELRPDR